MPMPTMKTQHWGQANKHTTFRLPHDILRSLEDKTNEAYWGPKRKEAVADYRTNRENGTTADNPSRAFPYDGKDTLEKGRGSNKPKWYYLTYTEGPGDKKWMAEKDRNYVARLQREQQLKENTETQKQKEKIPTLPPVLERQQTPEEVRRQQQEKETLEREKAEAERQQQEIEQQKALCDAATSGNLKKANTLLIKGGDVNVKALRSTDKSCLPPLFYAASNGHENMINLLLAYQADIKIKDDQGNTAADIAREKKYTALARRLSDTLEQVFENQETDDALDEANALLTTWETTPSVEAESAPVSTDSSETKAASTVASTSQLPNTQQHPTAPHYDTFMADMQRQQEKLQQELDESHDIQLWLLEQQKKETEKRAALHQEEETLKNKVTQLATREKQLTEELSTVSEDTTQALQRVQTELAITQAKQAANLRELTDFDRRMTKTEDSVDLLMHQHQVKLRDSENLKRFSRWPNALLYYTTLQRLIEDTFISAKAVAGGKAKVQDGSLKNWTHLLKAFGYLVPIPEIVIEAATEGISMVDEKRETHKAERTDRLNLSKMMDVAILVAERLTEWYLSPLRLVATLEEESAYIDYLKTQPTTDNDGVKKKAKQLKKAVRSAAKKAQPKWDKITLSNKPEPVMVELARCAKELIDTVLASESKPESNETLDMLMVRAVTDIPLEERDTLYKQVKAAIKTRFSKKIRLKEHPAESDPHSLEEVELLDLYLKPGLLSPNGDLYRHRRADADPNVYGYCTPKSDDAASRCAAAKKMAGFSSNKRMDYQQKRHAHQESEERSRQEEDELRILIKQQRGRMEIERQQQKQELQKHDERVEELKELHKTADTAKKAGQLIGLTLKIKEAEIKKAQKDAEEAHRKITKLKNENKQSGLKLKELSETVATLKTEKAELETKNSELELKVNRLESTMSEMQTLMKRLLETNGQTASINLDPSNNLFSQSRSEETPITPAKNVTTSKSEEEHDTNTFH